MNDGIHGYECHPEYKCSLFVNTAGPLEKNYCTILDYEVYTHNWSFSHEFPILSLFRLLDTQFHKNSAFCNHLITHQQYVFHTAFLQSPRISINSTHPYLSRSSMLLWLPCLITHPSLCFTILHLDSVSFLPFSSNSFRISQNTIEFWVFNHTIPCFWLAPPFHLFCENDPPNRGYSRLAEPLSFPPSVVFLCFFMVVFSYSLFCHSFQVCVKSSYFHRHSLPLCSS